MDADCHNAWRFKGPQHRDWKGHGRRPTSSSVLPGCAPVSYLSATPIPLPPTGLSGSLSSKRKSSPNISHKRTSLVKNTGGIFSVHAASSNPPLRGRRGCWLFRRLGAVLRLVVARSGQSAMCQDRLYAVAPVSCVTFIKKYGSKNHTKMHPSEAACKSSLFIYI